MIITSTALSHFIIATLMPNDVAIGQEIVFIYQLLFTRRFSIIWIWLAGVVCVAKGEFAVSAMIRLASARFKG